MKKLGKERQKSFWKSCSFLFLNEEIQSEKMQNNILPAFLLALHVVATEDELDKSLINSG